MRLTRTCGYCSRSTRSRSLGAVSFGSNLDASGHPGVVAGFFLNGGRVAWVLPEDACVRTSKGLKLWRGTKMRFGLVVDMSLLQGIPSVLRTLRTPQGRRFSPGGCFHGSGS